MVPILHKLFQKTEEEGTHLNLFYEARKILMPNTRRTLQETTLTDQYPHENRCKITF